MELREKLQTQLGGAYQIERELGGGGMSRVFAATETAFGRKVVIKVLPAELGAGVNVERFKREIQVAANLQHPHIVPVLTAGEMGDVPFYTMPFIDGQSLRARLARGSDSDRRVRLAAPRRGARARVCARAPGRPPRHQARQRADLRRVGDGDGLRHREGDFGRARRRHARRHRRRRADSARHVDRHSGLHGARASRRGSEHRSSRGHLLVRVHGVRDARGSAAVRRPVAAQAAGGAHGAKTAARVGAASGHAAGARRYRDAVSGKGS